MTPLTPMYLLCLESSSPTQEQESLALSNMEKFFCYTLYQAAMILRKFVTYVVITATSSFYE